MNMHQEQSIETRRKKAVAAATLQRDCSVRAQRMPELGPLQELIVMEFQKMSLLAPQRHRRRSRCTDT